MQFPAMTQDEECGLTPQCFAEFRDSVPRLPERRPIRMTQIDREQDGGRHDRGHIRRHLEQACCEFQFIVGECQAHGADNIRGREERILSFRHW